jgi:transposase
MSHRQVIDILMPRATCTEHQSFSKTCSCGCLNRGEFPENVTGSVKYGSNIETLIAYLNVRQYMPYNRIVEFFGQTMGLDISHGGVVGLLERFAAKAVPMHQEIKNRIEQAGTVGTDETGVKVNGKNHWMWVWQNEKLTYIVPAPSRGYQTIGQAFPDGLPNAVLVHDRWAAHFKTAVKDNQICIAHLFREFNYIQQVHQSDGATAFKDLLKNAIELSEKMDHDPFMQSQARDQLEKILDELLHRALPQQGRLAIRIQKNCVRSPGTYSAFCTTTTYPPIITARKEASETSRSNRKYPVLSGLSRALSTLPSLGRSLTQP